MREDLLEAINYMGRVLSFTSSTSCLRILDLEKASDIAWRLSIMRKFKFIEVFDGY